MSDSPQRTDVWVPLTILAVMGVAAAGLGALALGGGLASLVTGHGFHAPYNLDLLGAVVRGKLSTVWPGVPLGLVVTLAVLLALLVLVPLVYLAVRLWRRRPDPNDYVRHLAKREDVAHLTTPQLARKAGRLRPSLAQTPPEELDPDDVGHLLGALRETGNALHPGGPELRSTLEDVELAIMAPRSFKTSGYAIPRVLSAKGWVVVTSRRADVWQATASYRAKRGGAPIYAFDPQRIAHHPQEFWVDLLEHVTTVDDANRLAGHFVANVSDSSKQEIWGPAARELLAELVLAAKLDGRDLHTVYDWVTDSGTGVPAQILDRHPRFRALAKRYRARQGDPAETRGGVYATARIGAGCLSDPDIMDWVTRPSTPMPKLNFNHFVRGTGTLYLMSAKGDGSAAPLVAAVADFIARSAVRAAEAAGGRMDPVGRLILDEAANVCPIADLPDLYSYLGGMGINVFTILQSYKQGERVWGKLGMAALWGASTIKIIGAGIDDPQHAQEIATLVGDHQREVMSVTRSRGGSVSTNTAPQDKMIMTAGKVRALEKGTALLLATGTPVASIAIMPYHLHHPDRELIAELENAAKADVQRWATNHYSHAEGTA